MKKIFFSFFLFLFTILFSMPIWANDTMPIQIFLGQNQLETTVPAYLKGETTMVPLRDIFTELGYTVYWDDTSQRVTGIKEETVISLTIGSPTAYKNQSAIQLGTAPEIVDGYTMVPLRFVAEASGASVTWYGDSRTVVILPAEDMNPDILEAAESVVMITTNRLQGSGFILREDGLIATNYHIIDKATFLAVTFSDGTVYNGPITVRGFDFSRDLAIFQIEQTGLTPLPLGDSDSVQVSDSVTAIGSPMGNLNTVTTGIVLGKNKNIINTSAAIEHGSSGGVLLNSNMEVIGITSSYDTAGRYFSIPINYLKEVGQSGQYTLDQTSYLAAEPIAPKDITVTYTPNMANISWEPIYGADYFIVYRSDTLEGDYFPVENPATQNYHWSWGYPYCFSIQSEGPVQTYYKIATVVDGEISKLSDPISVSFNQ